MRKAALIVMITLLLFIVVFILLKYVFHQEEAAKPDKPNSVPASAVWKGDYDEGFWVDLLDTGISVKQYRFKIYRDYSGELAFDGVFKPNSKCRDFKNKESLLGGIISFQFTERYKLIINDSCSLEAIMPPYGGTLWEIDKSN